MRRLLTSAILLAAGLTAVAATAVPFGRGQLTVTPVARNAVRVQYVETQTKSDLPDWLYVRHDEVKDCEVRIDIDKKRQCLTLKDRQGRVVFTATSHQMAGTEATLTFASPKDEHLYGLGQFQDGYADVRGLSRRLTQVNTQISLPMLLSSKGYGVLWNNYGLTEFNPCGQSLPLVATTHHPTPRRKWLTSPPLRAAVGRCAAETTSRQPLISRKQATMPCCSTLGRRWHAVIT